MEPVFSSKRKRLPLCTELHPDTYKPLFVNQFARAKYEAMRHSLTPGICTSYNSFPDLFEKIKHIGWDCLFAFTDKQIFSELIVEFYSHMKFIRDSNGLLIGIYTIIQGQEYVINELFILHALHLNNCMLDLPRINEFLYPISMSTSSCITFKHNLATVSDQLVPAQLFDFPSIVGSEFFTAQCQFLSKYFCQNVMPVRPDKLLHLFDLELMKCILTEWMSYNLPYFLLTSFEFCFLNNWLGYGLLLTSIFKHIGIDISCAQTQIVQNSNIVSHLNLPPKPFIIFKPNDSEPIECHLNLLSQIDALNSLTQLSLQNQEKMMSQINELQLSVHHLKDMVSMLLEQQKVFIPPYQFSASTSTVPDDNLQSLGLHFSPMNSADF